MSASAEVPTQAVLLAAGEGRRMRPLTDRVPKPLVPFLGVPLLEHALTALAAAGVRRVAVNAWYRAERLVEHLRERAAARRDELEVRLAVERRLLGTGGGLAGLARHLDPGPLLVLTCDVVGQLDLAALARRHREAHAEATMLVVTEADVVRYGAVEVDERGLLRDVAGLLGRPAPRRGVNGSAHLVEPSFVARLGPGTCLVRDGYVPCLADGGRCAALLSPGPWREIGSPRLLAEATVAALRGALPVPPALWGRGGELRARDGSALAVPPHADDGASLVAPGAQLAAGVRLVHTVLGAGARVGARARLERCIVLGGGVVGAGEVLRDVIAGPGWRVDVAAPSVAGSAG